MTDDASLAADGEDRRVQLLREWSTGTGFDDSKVTEEALHAFSVDSAGELGTLLTEAIGLVPDRFQHYIDAFMNALLDQESAGLNLTARREKFLKNHTGIKYRSLIRHEHEGARLVVEAIDALHRLRSVVSDEDEDEDEVDFLRRRVETLEADVAAMRGSLEVLLLLAWDAEDSQNVLSGRMNDVIARVFEGQVHGYYPLEKQTRVSETRLHLTGADYAAWLQSDERKAKWRELGLTDGN